MYKAEKGEPFHTSLSFLAKMRQIPTSMEESYMKKFTTIFLISKVGCFFCTAIGPMLHLVVSVMSNSGIDLTEDVSITFGASGGGMVSLLFTLKYKEWSEFFKDLVDTENYPRPDDLKKISTRLNRLGKISFFCFSWVTIIYALAAWFSSKGCQDTSIQGKYGEICPTFVPMWLPFGTNDKLAGSIVFAFQTFFVGALTAQPFLTECFVMYESTEILICHISQLKKHLKSTLDSPFSKDTRDKLRFCIDYHVHILKLGYRLSSLIKYTAGHMSLLSALVCGCVANQMLNTKPMGSLIFLAAWLFALLCFCHSGQRIKDKTLSIADAIWDSKWYKAETKTQKDVQFILLRCQKPIYFEALPMGVTDYAFYFMMIRTGYSFFALFHKSL